MQQYSFRLKGSYTEALTYCNRLLDLDQDNPSGNYLKGTVLQDIDRYEEAVEVYKHSIALALKRVEDAIAEYEKTLELDAECQFAYFQLAYIYESKLRYGPAIKYYKKAIELDPKDIEALNNLGNTHYKAKN